MDYRLVFNEHPAFTRKLDKFCSKQHDEKALERLKKLLTEHFDKTNQFQLSERILRRINNIGTNIEAYKVNMVVVGLKPGQFPRICFWRLGIQIYFLCFGSHIDNYRDSELKDEVKKRICEIAGQEGLEVEV